MRNRLEHLQSPSAPTQPTYTHLSHTALCTNSDCTYITHRKNTARTSACRSHSSHSLSHAHTHYAHTHSHTRGLLAVSPAVEIGQPTPALVSVVLQSQSALHFLLRLTFLLRHALINILHGFYMDLFSFLLLSPRGAMATFSCLFNDCGWTINNLHTSKHSTTPTRCCRLNSQSEGKDMFSKKNTQKKHETRAGWGSWKIFESVLCILELTTAKRRILTRSLLQVVKVDVDYFRSRSCERSAWLVCSLPQTACQWEREKKTSVVSWVIIRNEKAGMNSRGRNYLLSSGYATGLAILRDAVPLILSRLHNLAAMREYKWEARLHK